MRILRDNVDITFSTRQTIFTTILRKKGCYFHIESDIFARMKYRKLKNSELNRISQVEFIASEKTPLIIILDNVRSLNNIGSVFRTADAFLVKKIYLCGITATPPHKDIQKTALGATDSVSWEYAENTMDVVNRLKSEGVFIASIEQSEHSIALDNFFLRKETTYAVIFGNEVKGISQEVVSESDIVIEIPQHGTKHSLNISVSTGIVIWDLFSKL
ncbi:MAG: 23S rRNA (guanosine2251-2'-O)-methyltransferase [Ulvibacter sp.]|jgi:23S rRNA (guanosine2251-2'-O)-methyltransferase